MHQLFWAGIKSGNIQGKQDNQTTALLRNGWYVPKMPFRSGEVPIANLDRSEYYGFTHVK